MHLREVLRGCDLGELQEIELLLGGLAVEEGVLGELLELAQERLRARRNGDGNYE